ncbi:MAG: hypothetical protein HC802_13830 [Caldilineaceae bacterium]|nr:hypothetical protein [Caldilineaceae bacterium]
MASWPRAADRVGLLPLCPVLISPPIHRTGYIASDRPERGADDDLPGLGIGLRHPVGLGAGTVLGAIISNVYIPFLQVGSTPEALTPPFLVEIAWPAIIRIYGLFALLFVAALSVLAVLLLRMKIFQAIKLGETV